VGLRSDLELNYKIEEQTMARGPLNEGEIKRYHEDGFVLVRGMFDRQEIEMLHASAKDDKALDDHAFDRADDQGGVVRLSLWNHPGNGIYGMFARCRSLVDSAEALLGGEVYHYHSKMIMKEPKVGGAWAWHQDYGYWYQNGVLFPLLTSAFIAVDRATKENGCLQVLKGSHLAGRVDHVLTGEQAGADPERVNELARRLELVHVEMEKGDVVFFEANLLHRSAQNHSDYPRWSMICCYNAARNDPYKDAHHPRYTPLSKVEDTKILEVGAKRFSDDASNVAWLDPGKDISAASLPEKAE
jgi:ectoine hydroxylase